MQVNPNSQEIVITVNRDNFYKSIKFKKPNAKSYRISKNSILSQSRLYFKILLYRCEMLSILSFNTGFVSKEKIDFNNKHIFDALIMTNESNPNVDQSLF